VSVDYFVDLGRGAYQGVAEAGREAYADLFARLAARSRELVAVLRAVRATPAGASMAPAGVALH